jgi:hypothetical protein
MAPGDIGALLRREGIYSSHPATPGAAQDRLVVELKSEVECLRNKRAEADLIVDAKKTFILLSLSTSDATGEPK